MNRTVLLTTACLPLALLLAPCAHSQPVPMQPGRYEVIATSTVTAAAGTEKGKAERASRCIKAETLANPDAVFNNRFLADFKPDESCKLGGVSIGGGKVAYGADCKYSTVRVEGTFTEGAYSVVRKAVNKGPGPSVETRIEGKRMGPCG